MSRVGSGEPSKGSKAVRLGRDLVLLLGILAVFAFVTLVFFWQWIPYLDSALIGPPEDNMQDFWNTWYASVARDSDFFFTELLRFPEGTPLYYHSFTYPKVLAIAMLSKVVGTDLSTLILLQNLSLLVSFPVAALGAFYLVRHFTGGVAGAWIGGFVFAFNPSHVQHVLHHAHVSSIEFIPFFVLSYLLALERRSALWLGLAIAFYALSALSSWYHLFYLAYFIGFHALYTSIRERAFPRGWELLAPVACGVGAAVLLSPLLVPMVTAAAGGGSEYTALGTDRFVADVAAYVAFPPVHLLAALGEPIYRNLSGNAWEATVYLGLVNIGVMGWLFLRSQTKDRALLSYVFWGMVVFCVFASGDTLRVLGHRTLPMPGALLAQLPFFENVRTPSRAILFVYLFLAIGVGQAATLAWREHSRLLRRSGLVALAVLMALDFYPARAEMTPVSCSRGLTMIGDDPEGGFGVLNLPSGRPAAYNESNVYMFQQATCHGRPILQGNTSRNVVVSLRDRLEVNDVEAQRRQLSGARVKYIVINHPAGELFSWRPEDGLQDEYLRTYPVVYNDSEMTVLRVY